MGHIHCCGGLRKARTFALSPETDYMFAQIDFLEFCPTCEHTVIQITRINKNYEVTSYRQTNRRARKLFEKLKSKITCEKNSENNLVTKYSKFYLNYNEYGKIKKCYSNLSTMKIGLFESR